MPLLDIKERIQFHLNELRYAETLKDVLVDDLTRNPFDRDFAAFPTAILTSPSVDSIELTNRQNTRTYTFEILIIHKADEIDSPTAIETLMETILNRFDNDPNLNGKADGGVAPSVSSPAPVLSRGQNLIAFSVLIQARMVHDLTF